MNILMFLGSVRDSTPPKPARVGERVTQAVKAHVEHYHPSVSIDVIDPLEWELSAVFKPHFAYTRSTVPDALQTLADKIDQADGYVMVSPEYNHSMSPALANLLNHFGSSLFSFKPSLIVTYSAGQWGGARAAVNMRTFLSELGCLPVSAMLHIPAAQAVFHEAGNLQDGQDPERWASYLERGLGQLLWWTQATAAQRQKQDPFQLSKALLRDPSQRNAPKI